MPRRGESIYKRKDGRWEARYVKEITADGKKKYGSVYADSYRAVKEKQQYQIVYFNQHKASNIVKDVADITSEWLRHIKMRVKPSSYQKYESLCRNHILLQIGRIKLTQLSRTAIETFAEKCLDSGLSVKSVNDVLIVLGLIFEFAEKEYEINTPKITAIREERKEARVLTVDEQNRLIAYLTANMNIYYFGMLLSLTTGMRIGELCALRWEDITEQSISITKTMQRLKDDSGGTQIVIGSPKSNSSKRIIPLPETVMPFIKKYRKDEGYILSTSRCIHAEPRILQQKFKAVTDKCHLENVTFYTLRHTFATRCVEAGFDIKTLSEILGHTDVKTTLNRYVHSSFELKQINMNKLINTFAF